MPHLPSHVTRTRGLAGRLIARGALICAALVGVWALGCRQHDRQSTGEDRSRFYPPHTETPHVVALGTYRGGRPPTENEIRLTRLLFGTEPLAPMSVGSPSSISTHDGYVLICDRATRAIYRWDLASGEIAERQTRANVVDPLAVHVTSKGDELICEFGRVVRVDPTGTELQTFTLADGEYRPVAAVEVSGAVWVCNAAQKRIEVFDAESGAHLCSIDEYGTETRGFGSPLGMATTPEGGICIVDALVGRAMLVDSADVTARDFGRARLLARDFGRPRDVAVGPDGFIFVTDALQQCVHVFSPGGVPVMTFGEPGSGIGSLTLPSGIAVATTRPLVVQSVPGDLSAQYYVLVGEQLNRAGVRVYAWLGSDGSAASALVDSRAAPPDEQRSNGSPHGNADSCGSCHRQRGSDVAPIPRDSVDEVCRTCHDGHAAATWGHPVSGKLTGPDREAPDGWPAIAGQLACVTCHDVRQQCRADAERAEPGEFLLRGHRPADKAGFCANCHRDAREWWASPHGQIGADGQRNLQACLFCHNAVPSVPENGERRFAADLRGGSEICLNCHARHWDYFAGGHVDRIVPEGFRRYMLEREQDVVSWRRDSADSDQHDPALLPLAGDRVACYSCHNPHQDGLFPAGSVLAARAQTPAEAAYFLRSDRPYLCLGCHDK